MSALRRTAGARVQPSEAGGLHRDSAPARSRRRLLRRRHDHSVGRNVVHAGPIGLHRARPQFWKCTATRVCRGSGSARVAVQDERIATQPPGTTLTLPWPPAGQGRASAPRRLVPSGNGNRQDFATELVGAEVEHEGRSVGSRIGGCMIGPPAMQAALSTRAGLTRSCAASNDLALVEHHTTVPAAQHAIGGARHRLDRQASPAALYLGQRVAREDHHAWV